MKRVMTIFGHGYTATALSKLLVADGWTVFGTTRSAASITEIEEAGVRGIIWPGEDVSGALAMSSHVLISIAPGEDGDLVLAKCADDFARKSGSLEWIGYLSTTAVYGDHQGGWVDESTPLNPSTKRGKWRVEAENGWLDLAQQYNLPLSIFRLAGIYGPGRGPFEKVQSGTARRIERPGQVFSRIHVDDIVQVLMASIEKPDSCAVYNVCDDEAAAPQDVISYAADLLGMPQPGVEDFDKAEMTPMARSFYSESKRVSNARAKKWLVVTLKYPTYREGLLALLHRGT